MKKPKKFYRCFYLHRDGYNYALHIKHHTYHGAFVKAIQILRKEKWQGVVCIISNYNTAVTVNYKTAILNGYKVK